MNEATQLRQRLGIVNNEHMPIQQPTPLPKVAVCVPSGDMVCKGFAMSLAAMAYMSGPLRDQPPIPLALVGVEGSLIVRNRNNAVEQAQKLGVDYMLFLDSDMQFPPFTLRRLLAAEKDIIGATYVQREEPHAILGRWAPDTQLTSDRPHEVDGIPTGCMLIKMSVFEKMTKPYFRTPAYEAEGDKPEYILGEDYYFCETAKKLGFSVWLDVALSMQLGHIGRSVATIQVKTVEQEADHGQAAANA